MSGPNNTIIHKQLHRKGIGLVALSGMMYGVLGYFGTSLVQVGFSVTNMLFWRFFIAFIWMVGFTFFSRKSIFSELTVNRRFVSMLIVGALTYSGSSAFYFWASASIGTGIAMVIFFAYPIFVILLSWYFSSWQISKHAIFSLLTVIAGLFLLKGKGEMVLSLPGLILALTAALCYAIYVYGSQHYAQKINSRLQTLLVCAGNSVIFLILCLHDNSLVLPKDLHAWTLVFALSVIATAVPIQLLLDGLKYVSPIKASILSVLEPVCTVIVGLILLHETLSLSQVAGIFVVLMGALIIQFEGHGEPKFNEQEN